jgi:hypothetical protein
MDYRALTASATLAFTGLAGVATICRADIVASQDGITVRDAGVAAPARGMTMSQVANKFGAPMTKIPAVGNPPITRWDYPGFVVYFERDHVIHSVVSETAPGDAAPAAAAPAPAAPVDQAPPSSPSAESEAPPST